MYKQSGKIKNLFVMEATVTTISKWVKKSSNGKMLKQVVIREVVGKNKKGKAIYSSRTQHIPA